MAKKVASKKQTSVKINKSEEIRKISEAVGKSPKAVVEALSAKGITVSPTLVSNVLTKGKKKSGKAKKSVAKRGRKPGAAVASTNGQGNVHAALVFVRQIGSLEAAVQLLTDLQEIRSL